MGAPPELPESPTRETWYPEREDITIYGILAALSDPTRLEIVRRLAAQPEQSPFEFLSMGTKQNLTTHHFKVLREAGLIKARYEGRVKYMWLRRDLIDPLLRRLARRDGCRAAGRCSDRAARPSVVIRATCRRSCGRGSSRSGVWAAARRASRCAPVVRRRDATGSVVVR